jgi:hypothetical protein
LESSGVSALFRSVRNARLIICYIYTINPT